MTTMEQTYVHQADGVRYVWNGSLTVNVWKRDRTGEWVNFDVFTLGEPTEDVSEVREAAERHHEDALEADHRYTLAHPTREQLLYG